GCAVPGNNNFEKFKKRPTLACRAWVVPTLSDSHVGPPVMPGPEMPPLLPDMGSDSIINELDKVRVFYLTGNGIPITDLWKDRKAVVAFARHFGCVFCRKRADYLASKKGEMDAAGVALVVIGPGSIDQAKAFYEQTKFKGEVYADPDHSSYEALRFVSGVTTTFTPKAGLKIIQFYMEGYRQDWELSFQRDTVSKGGWQQGGIIVAGPGKTNFSYIHKVETWIKKLAMIRLLKIFWKHAAAPPQKIIEVYCSLFALISMYSWH
ncbi:hypothetical protein KSS87_009007, partial [Heliosperma pusillum]